MAYITFRGGTKEQKKLAKSLAEFCLNKLISSRLSDTLDIRIVFKPTLYKKTESYGETTYYEDSNVPPKDFLIEIDSKLKIYYNSWLGVATVPFRKSAKKIFSTTSIKNLFKK